MNFKKLYLIIPLFFCSIAFANLGVTFLTSKLPDKPAAALGCVDDDEDDIDSDGAEEIRDVTFSDDGLTVFSANIDETNDKQIIQHTLSTAFDLDTVQNDCTQTRYDITSFTGVSAHNEIHNIFFEQDGTRLFVTTKLSEVLSFTLTTAFDISTAGSHVELDLTTDLSAVAFNNDGTKLYQLIPTSNSPQVKTFTMSTAYDIANASLSHTLDLSDSELATLNSNNKYAEDIHFNNSGTAMFILMEDRTTRSESYIYQFRLNTAFDVSTAELRGKWNVVMPFTSTGYGLPKGFDFSDDGMKLFLVNRQSGTGVDRMFSFQLECPFGLYECSDDATSNIGAQVELAKQNIRNNTSIIFKRFEWIKRNKSDHNLNSHNIKFKIQNSILASLANQIKPNLVKKSNKNGADTKWSYWSHGDISLGRRDETADRKPNYIHTGGLTFGADRKIGVNNFFGFAVRYGNDDANIKKSFYDVKMESLTFNLYGIIPKNKNTYINSVSGLSLMKFDQEYNGHVTGQRNGYQAFTSMNFRSKNRFGKFNITPSSKLTLGITHLSEYTDKVSIQASEENIKYKSEIFETAELAAGFLFNTEKIEIKNGHMIPNGGLEYYLDISPNIEFSQVGATSGQRNQSIKKYSDEILKGNIGFENVYMGGLTFAVNYERLQYISFLPGRIQENGKGYTDSLYFKIGYLDEEETNFAFNYNPINNNEANIDYTKNINGFDVKINSNYSLASKIPDYGANIEVSSKF